MPRSESHLWGFKSRFRRHAFGWKSQPAIQRVKQAVAEIKKAARQEPALAAEGAITFLERLSPALEHVERSMRLTAPARVPRRAPPFGVSFRRRRRARASSPRRQQAHRFVTRDMEATANAWWAVAAGISMTAGAFCPILPADCRRSA
jgi:hypothetical protein